MSCAAHRPSRKNPSSRSCPHSRNTRGGVSSPRNLARVAVAQCRRTSTVRMNLALLASHASTVTGGNGAPIGKRFKNDALNCFAAARHVATRNDARMRSRLRYQSFTGDMTFPTTSYSG